MSANNVDVYPCGQSSLEQKWSKQDTTWMLGMFGTAIGAGTLFLPINAGMHGIWPLLVFVVLALPMTYFSHRALCRFVLSGSDEKGDITHVVDDFFGHIAGQFLTFLYFFSIYPIVLMYSVAITNTVQSFVINQMGMTPLPRGMTSIILLIALMSVIRLGQQSIIKAMSLLVYPFIAVLMLLAVYLIPHWNGAIFTQVSVEGQSSGEFIKALWLGIPVIVFSFNHSPIISAFAVSQKKQHGQAADKPANRILKYSHCLMVVTVLFFVFSCVFSLSPSDLAQAKAQNLSILSYLANHFSQPFISYVAPLVAFIAIAKSFLGHYIGASEGMHGLILKGLRMNKLHYSRFQIYLVIDSFMVLSCWLVATLNPSILGMIESLAGPIVAALLFIMPMYAIYTVPAMAKYKNKVSDTFIIVIGLVAISATVFSLIS
jgi:serine transporter